jgi:predicted nuclease of restriction endonuclease-like (RecB) superfamily
MDKIQIEQYASLLGDIKQRIRQGQLKAVLSVNAEMLSMYWDIGEMIGQRQAREGWGTGVIPKLAKDLRNELPAVKGFSERNLRLMVQFFQEYPEGPSIWQQPVAKLGWAHHVVLMQKVKDRSNRFWYMQQAFEQGWGRDVLSLMIKSDLYARQGAEASNFGQTLPSPQSDLVQQMLKDPYIFDFMTLSEPFDERELETELVKHLEKFLLELGAGFAFVGRQYPLTVGDKDFYIDLLFYHLKLRCFVVIDLKKGEFLPEHAGKVSFYCAAVDDLLNHPTDQPSIGLILCQTKDKLVAEYALRNISKPIGVSAYELTRALPDNYKSSLPSIADLEAELGE